MSNTKLSIKLFIIGTIIAHSADAGICNFLLKAYHSPHQEGGAALHLPSSVHSAQTPRQKYDRAVEVYNEITRLQNLSVHKIPMGPNRWMTFEISDGKNSFYFYGKMLGVDQTNFDIIFSDINGKPVSVNPFQVVLSKIRLGKSKPELHRFSDSDSITLISKSGNTYPGQIVGYSDDGAFAYLRRMDGGISDMAVERLDLSQTRHLPIQMRKALTEDMFSDEAKPATAESFKPFSTGEWVSFTSKNGNLKSGEFIAIAPTGISMRFKGEAHITLYYYENIRSETIKKIDTPRFQWLKIPTNPREELQLLMQYVINVNGGPFSDLWNKENHIYQLNPFPIDIQPTLTTALKQEHGVENVFGFQYKGLNPKNQRRVLSHPYIQGQDFEYDDNLWIWGKFKPSPKGSTIKAYVNLNIEDHIRLFAGITAYLVQTSGTTGPVVGVKIGGEYADYSNRSDRMVIYFDDHKKVLEFSQFLDQYIAQYAQKPATYTPFTFRVGHGFISLGFDLKDKSWREWVSETVEMAVKNPECHDAMGNTNYDCMLETLKAHGIDKSYWLPQGSTKRNVTEFFKLPENPEKKH